MHFHTFHFQNLSLSLLNSCRDPKRHRELRQCLKKSCDGLRVHKKIDSCCYVLNDFLTKEFDKKLACTIEDIIEKVEASVSYPIPMQAERLCDLAEELSTRMKMLFLRNKGEPEKSWIVLDIDTLLSKINGRIFAPETLPEHCLTPTHTGVLPWSQIRRHLPNDLDPSLVVSFLGRLEFCQVVQDPEVLSLIKFGKSDIEDETSSPILSHRQSLCSQMSTSSSQTYSSGVSSVSCHTAGSGELSEQGSEHDGHPQRYHRRVSRDGLTNGWLETLYAPSTSPQKTVNRVQTELHPAASTEPQLQESPSTHPYTHPLTQLPAHSSTPLSTHPSSTPLQQPGNPPHPSSAQQHPLASQQQLPHNGVLHFNRDTFPHQPFRQEHISQEHSASSPTIITSPSLSTHSGSQVSFPPDGSGAGGLLSPISASHPLHRSSIGSCSLPNDSHLVDQREKKRQRQISLPPVTSSSQVSKLHDQMHNLHLTGGSQPSLPEEPAWLAAENRPYGYMHRSPSDSCTLSSSQPQYQCNTRARSQGGSPRASRNMNPDDKFLFFPALVNSGQPSGEMWLKDESFVFYSGWCLESAQSHKFFTPRFLQTLILRLAFGFAVSRRPNGILTSSLSLFSRECTIWKNGLRWLNLDGVETFVEMVEDGRALLLLMRAKKGSELRGVNLRSALIRKILDTKEECCPGIPTAEYLIHPKHLQERESYPIITDRLSDLSRYDISIVARAIVPEGNRLRPRELVYI